MIDLLWKSGRVTQTDAPECCAFVAVPVFPGCGDSVREILFRHRIWRHWRTGECRFYAEEGIDQRWLQQYVDLKVIDAGWAA